MNETDADIYHDQGTFFYVIGKTFTLSLYMKMRHNSLSGWFGYSVFGRVTCSRRTF